jgi:hypothetical protein
MVTPHHIPSYREPLPEPRFAYSVQNVTFSNVTCLSERPIGIVATGSLTRNIQLKDMIIQIVPEERPSLKGNVIDLAPGPVNYEIPHQGIGIVYKNTTLQIINVVNGTGTPVEVVEIQ